MPLTAELASLPFCCGETEGDKDLEDFFHHNALLYAQDWLLMRIISQKFLAFMSATSLNIYMPQKN